jgi:hypothetical protein
MLNQLRELGNIVAQKKGNPKMQVSQYKLLKTSVEKMSVFGSVYILMKNKPLIIVLCIC